MAKTEIPKAQRMAFAGKGIEQDRVPHGLGIYRLNTLYELTEGSEIPNILCGESPNQISSFIQVALADRQRQVLRGHIRRGQGGF
jgi:hypothetical protein